MMDRLLSRKILFLTLLLVAFAALLGFSLAHKTFFYDTLFHLQDAIKNGGELRAALLAYGYLAPLVYIAIQIMQVLIAPIPGEASGLLGGYLFGTMPSFIYSTIGLSIGSWLAFIIGRLLGDIIKKRLAGTKFYKKFNHLVEKGDFAIPFILFLFPGFPKDSLSYILGFSKMPIPAFLFVAIVGRIPGTLMLSMQGAEIYEGNYLKLLILLAISTAVTLPSVLYRKRLHAWLDKRSSNNQ